MNTDQSERQTPQGTGGFTLIELSIVLVIIGLIVGGVLVGQDLIRAAGIRATISQIEKYNTAINTFRGKYNALPGDLNNATASQFGFTSRGQYAGEGDGNGWIEGITADAAASTDFWAAFTGEAGMFWVDLTTANGLNLNMIEGGFHTATPTAVPATSSLTAAQVALYLPAAKIGQGNYIYLMGGGFTNAGGAGINYFTISVVTTNYWLGRPNTAPALTVRQAYDIDKKMDDGLPQTGNVAAFYNSSGGTSNWASGATGVSGAADPVTGGPTTLATSPSNTTCYDNGGSAGAAQQYSLSTNNGAGVNCALSFKFQ